MTKSNIPVSDDLDVGVYENDKMVAITSLENGPDVQCVIVFAHELPVLIQALVEANAQFAIGKRPDGTPPQILAWLVEQLVHEYEWRKPLQVENAALRGHLEPKEAEA